MLTDMVRQVDVRHALLAVHQLVGVIVVEDHDAVGAEHLDPRGMPERRVFFG